MSEFGDRIRTLRKAKRQEDKQFSLRKVAERTSISPTFLSRIESGKEQSLPSEEKIVLLARELGENEDVLLALAGKVSSRLKNIVMKRPKEFAELILQLENAPDHAWLRIIREVRDGDW